ADGFIYVGGIDGTAQEVAIDGDALMDRDGILTIQPNSISDAKLDKGTIPLSGFAPAGADVALGGFRLTDVAYPTDPQDAATKDYVDTKIADNAADGSETMLVDGTDISITGTGTAADPYNINSTFVESLRRAHVRTPVADADGLATTGLGAPANAADAGGEADVDTASAHR